VQNPDPVSFLFEQDKKSSTSSVLIERLHTNEKIQYMCPAKVITPAAEVPGELLIGESCLYFVADVSMLEMDLAEVCSRSHVALSMKLLRNSCAQVQGMLRYRLAWFAISASGTL
jgi:hypothetical protein